MNEMISETGNVKKLKPYNPPTASRLGKMRLDFNENTLGPSPRVLTAIKNVSAERLSAYPEYSELTKAIADYNNAKPENAVPFNGSDEAIRGCIECFVGNGKIVIPTPSFAMFYFYAELQGAKIAKPLYNEDLSFPTQKVLAEIKGSRAVILCNPNNPTATEIPEKDLIEIIRAARAEGCLAIVDEAYSEFTKETVAGRIGEFDNLVVLKTFSKAMGLGGMRIGYALGNEKIISTLKKAKSPYSITALSALAATEALKDPAYMQDYVKQVEAGRAILEKFLDEKGVKRFPSKSNFLVARFGKNAKAIAEKLKEKGFLVRDRSGYERLEGCIRISIGTPEQMKKFCSALEKVLGETK
ncbi:MAG: histidinol-phosphate transaminase [Candidatus Diapherotrites archaeon]|nr:histidinol-phosphate transaminase [Candidatus Diapherotrites archaeon]